MSGEERQQLVNLIRLYVGRATDEVAENEWRRIEAAGLETITFAWMGSEEFPARPLLRDKGANVPDRVRQHPGRRHPHPLGLAGLHQRLGRGPAGRPTMPASIRPEAILSRRSPPPEAAQPTTDLA